MYKEKTMRESLGKSFLLPLTVSGFVLFSCLVLAFAGCKSDKSFEDEVTGSVTFKLRAPGTDDKSFKKSFVVGAPVAIPASPELEGYQFNGWYEEDVYKAEAKAYSFTQKERRKDLTLYAWWFTVDGGIPDWLTEEPFNITIIDGIDSKDAWNAAVTYIKGNGNGQRYRINLTGDFNLPGSTNNTFGDLKDIEVEIKGTGNTIGLESYGRLLQIGESQTLVLNDITLQGKADPGASLVQIDRGALTMKGAAAVSGNTSGGSGGGVAVFSGVFTMQDNATVSGNTASYGTSGGGVYVVGTFIMRDNATVSGNTTEGDGGGVYVTGTFTMQDNATVSGNVALYGEGGGVFLSDDLRMAGGTIYGNNAGINSNTAATSAALSVGGSAEYGVFNGTDWVSAGTLPNRVDNTIKVVNGALEP